MYAQFTSCVYGGIAQLFYHYWFEMNHVIHYRPGSSLLLYFLNFLKKTEASSIRTCGLFADIRLKYCGEEKFFIQATLAIKFLNFLFPKKSQIQHRKNYINIKCIFRFEYFPVDLLFQEFS